MTYEFQSCIVFCTKHEHKVENDLSLFWKNNEAISVQYNHFMTSFGNFHCPFIRFLYYIGNWHI